MYDMDGLVMHRAHMTYKDLNSVLNMHTMLQVHPFIPRTYVMHAVTKGCEKSTAVFVRESPREASLGSGLTYSINIRDKATASYHVLRCLLRAQILTTKTLDFALKIHRARIWRHKELGFRIDILGSMLNTFYEWHKDRRASRTTTHREIYDTMTRLQLVEHIPKTVYDALTDTVSLYKVYNVQVLELQDRREQFAQDALGHQNLH